MRGTPICSTLFGVVGTVAGLGFGIYASVKNFDLDNQSDSMTHASRFLSELLTQGGFATLQAATLGFFAGVAGAVFDCAISCCSAASDHRGPALLSRE